MMLDEILEERATDLYIYHSALHGRLSTIQYESLQRVKTRGSSWRSTWRQLERSAMVCIE